MNESAEFNPSGARWPQFRIAALFWVTFSIGLGIAYLQRLYAAEIILGGPISLMIGASAGALLGKLFANVWDGLFWGTLIAAFGYLTVASDPIYDMRLRLAWAFIGAATGATAGSLLNRTSPKPLTAVCIIASGLAAIVMFAHTFIGRFSLDAKLDLLAAPIVGVLVVVFVKLLLWMEARYKTPRYVTATWSLLVVILGNWLA